MSQDEGHEQAERQTWCVIALCSAMMVLKVIGGDVRRLRFRGGRAAHSPYFEALLLAALAHGHLRKYAHDTRFMLGVGRQGDPVGFGSAMVPATIASSIGYVAFSRVFAPLPIRVSEAIPIAVLGLAVNATSVWFLSEVE